MRRLPLALELIAAQLAAMSVADLLDHLPEVIAEAEGSCGHRPEQLRTAADDRPAVFRLLGVLDGQVPCRWCATWCRRTDAPVRVVRILRELTARGLLAVDRSGPRWRYYQDDDLHRYAVSCWLPWRGTRRT